MELSTFLGSSLVQNLITLAAALIGLYAAKMYFKQKDDFKRDSATIILSEIRHAEEKRNEVKNVINSGGNIRDYITFGGVKFLVSNSWSKYSHLFVNDFDEDEFSQINKLFDNCKVLDDAFEWLNLGQNLKFKSEAMMNGLSNIAIKSTTETEYQQLRDRYWTMINSETYLFFPEVANLMIKTAIENMSDITTSSIGLKLKRMSKGKINFLKRLYSNIINRD